MPRLRHSIRARVIVLSLTFTALIALSVFLASVLTLYRSTTRATAQSTEYNLQVAANTLYQSVAEIDTLANWCTVDSTVRNFVFTSSPSKQLLDVYNLVLNKYSSQHTARYLRRLLVTDGATRIMQQGTAVAQSMALNADTLSLLPGFTGGQKENSWTMLATDPLILYGQKEIIPVIRTISSQTSGQTAEVYIAVSSDLITDTVQDYALMDGCELFWFMDNRVWQIQDGSLLPVENDETTFAQRADADRFELLDSRTRVFDYQGQIVLAYPVGSHDLYIAQTLPSTVILGQLPAMLMPLLWALAAILLLGVVLTMLLRHMISAPVQALQDQLTRIG